MTTTEVFNQEQLLTEIASWLVHNTGYPYDWHVSSPPPECLRSYIEDQVVELERQTGEASADWVDEVRNGVAFEGGWA